MLMWSVVIWCISRENGLNWAHTSETHVHTKFRCLVHPRTETWLFQLSYTLCESIGITRTNNFGNNNFINVTLRLISNKRSLASNFYMRKTLVASLCYKFYALFTRREGWTVISIAHLPVSHAPLKTITYLLSWKVCQRNITLRWTRQPPWFFSFKTGDNLRASSVTRYVKEAIMQHC